MATIVARNPMIVTIRGVLIIDLLQFFQPFLFLRLEVVLRDQSIFEKSFELVKPSHQIVAGRLCLRGFHRFTQLLANWYTGTQSYPYS